MRHWYTTAHLSIGPCGATRIQPRMGRTTPQMGKVLHQATQVLLSVDDRITLRAFQEEI